MNQVPTATRADWPELPSSEWGETLETIHMWFQIVGKVRATQAPWSNHSWSSPLYVTSRGLTTSPIPYGGRTFQIDFDFVDHRMPIHVSDGRTSVVPLRPQSVKAFYHTLFEALERLGIELSIHGAPNEVPDPIPFAENEVNASYDREHARKLWQAMVQADRVLNAFRARYIGKASPVHFFWGGPDIAVTRFSGRLAPEHPGGIPNLPDVITREAYSHELTSCGFWPGNRDAPDPIFYAYAYPTPDGFSDAAVEPDAAFWLADLGEFVLPYEAVRMSDAPDETVDAFLQTTHDTAAALLGWDQEGLVREPGYRPLPRKPRRPIRDEGELGG